MPQSQPVLHQMQMSGNCYKIRLAAHQLGVALTLKDYPLHSGETRIPKFLAKNPNGRVPMLEYKETPRWPNAPDQRKAPPPAPLVRQGPIIRRGARNASYMWTI